MQKYCSQTRSHNAFTCGVTVTKRHTMADNHPPPKRLRCQTPCTRTLARMSFYSQKSLKTSLKCCYRCLHCSPAVLLFPVVAARPLRCVDKFLYYFAGYLPLSGRFGGDKRDDPFITSTGRIWLLAQGLREKPNLISHIDTLRE